MRNLIIVCEEKCRSYGDYLAQLISLDDDTEESIVGVKDGAVAAQVWSEKDYKSNAAQISSNQYILFIGNSKLIKEKSMNMNIKFDKYGMKYGWLGKQAMLSVEKSVASDEYEDFVSFAKTYQSNIDTLIKKNSFGKNAAKVAGLGALFAVFGATVPVGVIAVKKLALTNKIKEQQYSCSIMKFYLDDLSSFLAI